MVRNKLKKHITKQDKNDDGHRQVIKYGNNKTEAKYSLDGDANIHSLDGDASVHSLDGDASVNFARWRY